MCLITLFSPIYFFMNLKQFILGLAQSEQSWTSRGKNKRMRSPYLRPRPALV